MQVVDALTPGTRVQTPLGKGIVREALNGGRVLVDVGTRAVIFRASEVTASSDGSRSAARSAPASATSLNLSSPPRLTREIDLHGLAVEEALARVDDVLNDAILDGVTELRIIHGRSGGRIRGALHKRLREIGAITSFRLDERNAGVTIVNI